MFARCLLVLFLLILQPVTAFAYSYGDPNKEDVAETYKEIAARLEKSPADWEGAVSAFNSRKAEIALEFGNSITETLETNFKQKQKDLVLQNYRAVLVKNVERRLNSAEKEFQDYAKAKLMLAKGRGTFQVIAPFVKEATSKQIYDAFDKSLTALGNPGLFGVGVVPADKQEFIKQKQIILKTLKPLFPVKAAEAKAEPAKPAPAKPAQTPKPAAAPAEAQPQKQAQTISPVATGQDPNQPVSSQAGATAGTQPNPATTTAAPADAAAATPAVPTTEPDPAATNQQPAPAAASEPAQTSDTQSSAQTAATTEAAAQSAAETSADSADTSHAGESKVNPAVTIGVIAGILAIAGAAFWFGKRKGLL